MQQAKRASKGETVALVQCMLKESGYDCGSADGIFGAKTEQAAKAYQKAQGLAADGIVGNKTYAKLFADNLLKRGRRGALVTQLQRMLNEKGYSAGTADGVFGEKTEAAVKAFQRAQGLTADGIVGAKTWAALVEGNETPTSAHFTLREFGCKDGTAVPRAYYPNCQALMHLLEEIRAACGDRPITITSGYRTKSHNQKCGGAPKSQHLTASAADIKVQGMSPNDVYTLCDRLVGSRGGVGKYKGFTHVDVRGYKARW